MNLKSLRFDERGTAMTEFVIMLPVYITIFIGMGSIYKLNQAGLESMATANHRVWSEVQRTSFAMTPAANALNITNVTELVTDGINGLGIYKESFLKAQLVRPIPGAPGVNPLEHSVERVGGFGTNGHSRKMLDDFYDIQGLKDANGITGWAVAIIGAAGLKLGFAAGIRYGARNGDVPTNNVTTPFGTFAINPGRLRLPHNTEATHRAIPVAMARLQFSTDDVFNESILNFNFDLNTDGEPDIGTIASGSTDEPPPIGSCGAQARAYSDCITPLIQGGTDPDDAEDACEGSKPDSGCDDISGTSLPNPDPAMCVQFNIPPDKCKIQ